MLTNHSSKACWVLFSVVKRVLLRKDLKLGGNLLKVRPVPEETISPDTTPTPGTSSEDGTTVEVRGFKPETTEDALLYFFENTKRSGGGDVENVTLLPERKLARVTFCSKTGA